MEKSFRNDILNYFRGSALIPAADLLQEIVFSSFETFRKFFKGVDSNFSMSFKENMPASSFEGKGI